MNVPPPELASWVSLLKDILTGCAAVVGATVAVLGLNAWRKQLKGKTDYELARRLLKATYKVRAAIRFVRDPAIWSNEVAAAEREVKIDEQQLKANPSAARDFAVYQTRWQKMVDAMTELDAESFEAEISWGKPAKEKIVELRKVVAMLRLAINQHIDAKLDPRPLAGSQLSEMRDALYDTSEPSMPDAFTQRVQTAVSALEDFLCPHLGSK